MPNLWLIFLTGLTTGGLTCLAVQGGLLANVIANQADEDLKDQESHDPSTKTAQATNKHDLLNRFDNQRLRQAKITNRLRSDVTGAILLFLVAKVIGYTILGFLLGYLGTALQLTPIARGVLMIAIALFMIGTALRMWEVHPIFNYFQIQPPKFIRRFIRRVSKNSREDVATPLFLGLLTVLIPCGVTQAMMFVALGTNSPVAGALVMLAFTLGTTPIFFFLAYFTTRLGERLNARFLTLVATIVLILGLYSLESGLNLVGSPVSYAAVRERLNTPSENSELSRQTPTPPTEKPTNSEPPSPSVPADNTPVELKIDVLDFGYEPDYLKAPANRPIRLSLTTYETYSCSRAFVIPTLKIQKVLPVSGTEVIEIPPQKSGTLRFMCSMGMYTGRIVFN